MNFQRLLIAYAVAIPLALILGYLVATPDVASLAVVGMLVFFLALPLLLRWHHWLLILSWNSIFVANFLPGQMQFWQILALLSFSLALLHRFMGHRDFIRAPELSKPIFFLAAVVLVTARIRGGLGMRVLGSSGYGGKNYFFVLVAIIGYFALISQPIAKPKQVRAGNWFFLSLTSSVVANIAYAIGPVAYFIYWICPVGGVGGQAQQMWTEDETQRLIGFAGLGSGLLSFALSRWGCRGLLTLKKPWRMSFVVFAFAAAFLTGFRSQTIFLIFLFAIQFWVEGLWKTPMFPAMALAGILCLAPVILFTNKMPNSVQRSLAFLPAEVVDINPDIRDDAQGSTEWRLGMWSELLPDVPKYLFIGKGYSIDPDELAEVNQAAAAGLTQGYEPSLVAGDYHSGPFSILIPFGIFGTFGFLWMLAAGTKALYNNWRYGDVRLKSVNATLFAYFVATILVFFFVFGAFNSELGTFLGLLGLSVSLNGGVRKRPSLVRQTVLPSSMAVAVAV